MAAIILSPLPHFFSLLEHRCILYSTISCSNVAFSLHGITPIRFLFSWNLYHGRLSSIPLYHSMKSGINKLFTIMHQQDLQGNPKQAWAILSYPNRLYQNTLHCRMLLWAIPRNFKISCAAWGTLGGPGQLVQMGVR